MDRSTAANGHQNQARERPPKKTWYRWWRDYHQDVNYIEIDYRRREKQILKIVDDNGFKFTVFAVAASGFLASSYSLAATNVIMTPLYYVFPTCGRLKGTPIAGEVIDELTLTGSVIGMLVMGHLADRSGRKRWYGVELAVMIVAAMGLLQASEGLMIQSSDGSYDHSMDVYAWVAVWRIVIGFGIGAEYPLSAVIAAEWASTESRGVTLAAVFAMQSIGRLLVYAFGLAALRVTSAKWDLQKQDQAGPLSKLVVDQAWRWVIGIGIIPAAIAIIARLTIPETPRYYVDIREDLRKAIKNALRVYRWDKKGRQQKTRTNVANTDLPAVRHDTDEADEHWYAGCWNYLWGEKKAIRPLALISVIWAIMDVAWYSLSLDSPGAQSILAHDPSTNKSAYGFEQKRALTNSCNDTTGWNTDFWDPANNISDMLQSTSIRSLLIICIASVIGSIGSIFIINIFRRKLILICCFIVIAVLFAIAGGSLVGSFNAGKSHVAATVFYALLQFVFNLGPNTLTFVLPAEMFPTVYRGTLYGVTAACGKIGAIIIRAIIGGNTDNRGEVWLGVRLLALIPFMFLCALLSWWLPDVQYRSGSHLTRVEAGISGKDEPIEMDAGTWTDAGTGIDAGMGIDAGQSQGVTEHGRSTKADLKRKNGLRNLFRRLKNIPLEDIAPNPTPQRVKRDVGGTSPRGVE